MNKFRVISFFVVLAMLFSFANVSPAVAAAPIVHFDANALALQNGATVTAWGGQSAAGTPTFLTNQTPNGMPAVEFNGGGDRMGNNVAVPASTAGDWILVAVIKPRNIGAYHNLADDDPSGRPMLWIDPSFNYEMNFGGGTGAKAAGTGTDGWDIVIADSRLNQLYVNSPIPNATGRSSISYSATKLYDFFHRDGLQNFQGLVAEMRIYNDRAEFGGDFAALHSEMVAKYFHVINSAPTADAGSSYNGSEGSAIAMSGATASDPDMSDTLIYSWSVDSALCSFGDAGVLNPNLTCSDNGNYTVTLSVDDGVNPAVSSDATVTVSNVAPTIGAISVDLVLIPVNTLINTSASFTDPGANDTHTAAWDWGDTSTLISTVTQGTGSGLVNDSHSYSEPGVYTVMLTITDDDSADSNVSEYKYVVVYDPSAGFVTGGGWVVSPAGALVDSPTATGKAEFGFVAKYKQGATVPSGNTEFQFEAGKFHFHSTNYQWLVVAGAKAQFKGEGTVEGSNHQYGFMLTAIDGQINGGGNVDKFRLKIWDLDGGGVVYDNQIGGADDSDPSTAISKGSIVIHKK